MTKILSNIHYSIKLKTASILNENCACMYMYVDILPRPGWPNCDGEFVIEGD